MTIKELNKNIYKIAFPKDEIKIKHFGDAKFEIGENVVFQGKNSKVIGIYENNFYILKDENGIQTIAYNFYMEKI